MSRVRGRPRRGWSRRRSYGRRRSGRYGGEGRCCRGCLTQLHSADPETRDYQTGRRSERASQDRDWLSFSIDLAAYQAMECRSHSACECADAVTRIGRGLASGLAWVTSAGWWMVRVDGHAATVQSMYEVCMCTFVHTYSYKYMHNSRAGQAPSADTFLFWNGAHRPSVSVARNVHFRPHWQGKFATRPW